MTKLLLSKPVVEQEIESLKKKCDSLKSKGVHPFLKVVLVGNHEPSLIYTRNKKKFCERFGAKCEIIHLDEKTSEKDFLNTVNDINHDQLVHGCLIQLPLPSHLSHVDVGKLVVPEKDVDGFSADNLIRLLRGDKGTGTLLPCTPKGIVTLLEHYKVDIQGKNIVVVGRSIIVGKTATLLLSNHNATVTMCHSKTQNLKDHIRHADIIIAAIGKAEFLSADYFNPDKNQVVIDVGQGFNKENKLCGDVHFDSVSKVVSAITPVPGGVGPMTILSLAQNLMQATEATLKL